MSKSTLDSQPSESHSQRLSDRHNVDLWLTKKSSELQVLGAILKVVPDSYNPKRDYITCTRVPPHERHKHLPDLVANETICGNIFTVIANRKVLKNGITLCLPISPPSYPDLQELRLMVKYKDDQTAAWLYGQFAVVEKGGENKTPFIEVQVNRNATYVPTILPKREVFAVTDQGLLYNARISRYVAVRFPRKCIDRPQLEYYIEVHPFGVDKEQELRRDYPEEMAPFESISDFVDIIGPQMQFKRPIGLKLGVPAAARDMELDYLASAIVVIRKSTTADESWWVIEDSIKVTKTTVSFTTKELGRFIVAVVEPSKKLWLRKYMPFIEQMNSTSRCEVLIFTKFEKKSWSLLVETVPASSAVAVADSRELAGMRCVNRPRRTAVSAVDAETAAQAGSGERDKYLDGRLSARRQRSANRDSALSLRDSAVCCWIEISGDLRPLDGEEETSGSGGGSSNSRRLYEQVCCFALEENFRLFDVEPVAQTAMAAASVGADGRGCVSLYVERRGLAGPRTAASAGAPAAAAAGRECVRTWDFDIPRRDIEEYFFIEEEKTQTEAVASAMDVDEISVEEMEKPERRRSAGTAASVSSAVAVVVEPARSPRRASQIERAERVRQREMTVVNLMRLTESKRAKVKVDREPKVLSGRSLMTLSRRVEEGLTLAVYLDIPDSTITGLGFDALANGMSLQEVTYKILLLWKRRTAVGGQAKVEQLAGALKAMGREDVVTQLWEHHLKNAELTPESFMSNGDAGAEDDVGIDEDQVVA